MQSHFAPFRDPTFNLQWLRAVGHAHAGGAEIGECLAVTRGIVDGDLSSWHTQWHAAGERLAEAAARERRAGRRANARGAYLRAANYLRTAGVFLLGSPDTMAAADCDRRQRDCFRAAVALGDTPAREVTIEMEGTPLHGWLFNAAADERPRPTVIINGGYDSNAEECWFFSGAAAVARGFNAVCFDGPGQGSALLQQGLVMRPDWEVVIAHVVDLIAAQPEVDASRIALLGISLGGHLALRAASGEPRLAALLLDPGQHALHEEFLTRVPPVLRTPVRRRAPWAMALIGAMLRRRARHPTRGWTLRRGMQVHGLADPLAYVEETRRYTLEGRIGNVRCPTLVCRAEHDEIGATASMAYDQLTSAKAWIEFRADEGAGDHCEMGARSLFNERAFAWLDLAMSKP